MADPSASPTMMGSSHEALRSHYDLPVPFYALWLDAGLNYSSALWEGDDDLDAAHARRLAYWGRALGLTAGKRLLDVGCGWGGAIGGLARQHDGLEIVGLTLGVAHRDYCLAVHPAHTVHLCHWNEHVAVADYDAVLNVEAIEHFARPNISPRDREATYRAYFERMWTWLRPGGRAGLQVICAADGLDPRDSGRPVARFIHGDILRDTSLPELAELAVASHQHFVLTTCADRTEHYRKTLRRWYDRLRSSRAAAADTVGDGTVARFLAYFSTCEVAFRRRDCELYFMTFARRDSPLPPSDRHP